MSKSDQKRQAALVALMSSNTLTEAAEKAGIDRRTLYNYLHHDIDFARAYDEMRSMQAINLLDEMTERRQQASAVIMDLMNDAEQPGIIRLKAAQAILDAAAQQNRIVGSIASNNIAANKDMWDFSTR